MVDNSINGIIDQLDVHLLWYNFMTKYCPSPSELNSFNKMDKTEQYNYLKEIMNEDK